MGDIDAVTVVRRFNRGYTQRLGLLSDSHLQTGLPLGAARLLFEIGTRPAAVQDLRARLGLDSGYLSRLLRRLEDDHLVEVTTDPADRRRRRVELSARGRGAFADLEERSDAQARLIVDPLSPRQRARLVAALAEADLLVRAATVTLETVDPRASTARDALDRYFAELVRRDAYAPTGAEEAEDASRLAPPGGVFLVAVSDGEPVACGGVRTLGDGVCEIKRMWVHDAWRGAGLGTRLLRALEDAGRGMGNHTVRLDTNEALTEAIAMYERCGYQAIARYNDNASATHFFSRPLV